MYTNRAAEVLVIDEEEYLRDGIKCFLEDFGYHVIQAEDGRAGLELFEELLPDIVLCDISGSDRGYIDVISQIVARGPEIPMIIISSSGNISLTVEALKTGAWDYILKPIQDMSVILHSIKKSLEKVALVKEKDLYKMKLLNKAVDAGRSQLAAMILHNIGNAITPVAVYTEQLKKKDWSESHLYLSKCFAELLKNRDHLTEYITLEPRGIEITEYMGNLIDMIGSEYKKTASIIEKIASSIDYVSQIITMQRTYAPSKLEGKEKVSINSLLMDAVKMQQFSFDSSNIGLKENFADPSPQVLIEKNKLMQVIVNLLKNSFEAINENSKKKDHLIEITTYSENDRILVRISDSGIGVGKEQIREIFDFGTSTKGASGFGLYYCKSFLESNNGSIRLESRGIGFGSTVIVELQSAQN